MRRVSAADSMTLVSHLQHDPMEIRKGQSPTQSHGNELDRPEDRYCSFIPVSFS